MNVDTGKIRWLNDGEKPTDREVALDASNMTELQRQTMTVSPHDSNSAAGQVFTANRKARREQERADRRIARRAIRKAARK